MFKKNEELTVHEIRERMTQAGLTENSDYRISVDPYNTDKFKVEFFVTMKSQELPEELKHYEVDGEEIDRFMYKGNSDKESFFGTSYYLALGAYQGDILHNNEEYLELFNSDLTQFKTIEELDAFEKDLHALGEKILAEHPLFPSFEKELESLV